MPETAEMPQTATNQDRETGMGSQAAPTGAAGAPQTQVPPVTAPQQTSGAGMTGRSGSQLPSRSFRDPFTLMRYLSDEMDRLFEGFGLGGRSWPALGRGSERRGGAGMPALWSPQVEVARRGNDFVVCADLPGLSKEDINVEIREDHLILQGERRSENETEREGVFRSERSYGRFFRTIPLPAGIDPSQADAQFRDGVLEIRMPMPQQQAEEQGRRIEIR
ncbi:MAG TPA: Hsp20/alpha crystallin family protein [Thermoanaerobaculia bacterium]|nr:Hsp20/alpha crystallin family protein [Thermoanaerobaculia bacterium]